MRRMIFATLLVTLIIFVVPILVYGAFSHVGFATMPGDNPLRFLFGVLVSKFGTAMAFVAFFLLSPQELGKDWKVYALIWFGMFALGEIGQAIGPDYPWSEAIAGIISEAIYFPASAFIIYKILGREKE